VSDFHTSQSLLVALARSSRASAASYIVLYGKECVACYWKIYPFTWFDGGILLK